MRHLHFFSRRFLSTGLINKAPYAMTRSNTFSKASCRYLSSSDESDSLAGKIKYVTDYIDLNSMENEDILQMPTGFLDVFLEFLDVYGVTKPFILFTLTAPSLVFNFVNHFLSRKSKIQSIYDTRELLFLKEKYIGIDNHSHIDNIQVLNNRAMSHFLIICASGLIRGMIFGLAFMFFKNLPEKYLDLGLTETLESEVNDSKLKEEKSVGSLSEFIYWFSGETTLSSKKYNFSVNMLYSAAIAIVIFTVANGPFRYFGILMSPITSYFTSNLPLGYVLILFLINITNMIVNFILTKPYFIRLFGLVDNAKHSKLAAEMVAKKYGHNTGIVDAAPKIIIGSKRRHMK